MIQLQDKELSAAKAVADTVEREMKTFSSVVSSNCAAAVAPTRLQAVIKRAATPSKEADETDRGRNIILYNVNEMLGEETAGNINEDIKYVGEIIEALGEKFQLSDVKRIGVKREAHASGEKARPMVATLSSRENVLTLLRKAKLLRENEEFSLVYLAPDRSFEERKERKRTIETLKKLKADNPAKQYVLRRGVIECV